MSIFSEISILSYCNNFLTHTNIHLKKLMDDIYHLLEKTNRNIIVILWSFSVSLKGKLSSESNLIFMKSFLNSPGLLPFIVSIQFLIPSQSSVYFVNTSLFLSVKTRVKYLLPFSSLMYPSILLIINYKRFTLLIFTYSESFIVIYQM